MNSFGKRILKATKFEKQVFSTLKDLGFDVAMNGTEHHYPDFVNSLRRSNDQTSLAIRFQPDGIISFGGVPQSCFIDPKASKTIEKAAYLQYQKLYKNGNKIILIFGGYANSWNFFEKIRLTLAKDTISSFSPDKRFPIDSNGWIAPRLSPYRYKLNKPDASWTPYREVDETSLEHWIFFKTKVAEILCQKAID